MPEQIAQSSWWNPFRRSGYSRIGEEPRTSVTAPSVLNPKVFLANERTFVAWLHFALVIGAVAISMLQFSDAEGGSPTKFMGLGFTVLSVIIIGYSLWMYLQRLNRLQRKDFGTYDDLFGTGAMVLIVFAIIACNIGIRIIQIEV
ncbi:uncharacterized protein BJ171DRAFT_582516 [Polychytrium aggregatum]|uniref:uncharacterized protein n=1 Tax=Polychytrium aggregatum TaxID=110093 RepID=UPI0022FEAA8C|nr:uncharacterized protein BJ171DRAFT_582516 [Polychytrium aggregatum]KAI9203748.1 hypothetical protein BJ171DRAFT_582516 [Polychytrium aggregatum]